MKVIHGVEIDESEDLYFNLRKIRRELSNRLDFWMRYQKGIDKLEDRIDGKLGLLNRGLFFVSVLPAYFRFLLQKSKREALITAAEEELVDYYGLPETKVRHFRLACEREQDKYKTELELIGEELAIQQKNYESSLIGKKMKEEIILIITQFKEKQQKKEQKYHFYKSSAEKLQGIEEQLRVKRSMEAAKGRLKALEEGHHDQVKQLEMKKEVQLYQYYGQILDELSANLQRLKADKEEEIEALELQQILDQIKLKN